MSAQVQWLSASPLWNELSTAADLTAFRRPTILRFSNDDFVQKLQALLRSTPQDLRQYVAQGETWSSPAVGIQATTNSVPLKLYQPPQARFYLVATSLACRMPGLPDHSVNKAQGEVISFVVRQLRPLTGFSPADCAIYSPNTCAEYAWVVPTGDQPGWMPVSTTLGLVDNEERIPLSTMISGANGSRRRIHTGLIPASRRQQYIAGRTLANGSGNSQGGGQNGTSSDPRLTMLNAQIVTPWSNLLDWWNTDIAPNPPTPLQPYTVSSKQSSALILLDFANFLSAPSNLPNVWAAIQSNSQVNNLTSAELAVYNALGSGLRQALTDAMQFGTTLESAGVNDTFPPSGYTPYALTDSANAIDLSSLVQLIQAAMPDLSQITPPPTLPPPPMKPSNPLGDFYFIVRAVYERPQCGLKPAAVLSEPSQPFLLASFFDPDAPVRRLQVALPVDVSAAALRKYDKGVAFLISDQLQRQIKRVTGLKDLADGNIGTAGPDAGLICSFSIPIITICALILLMVIVIALNIVFFWIPFFKICFPVPGLKGK
jgi:hypothetical protein